MLSNSLLIIKNKLNTKVNFNNIKEEYYYDFFKGKKINDLINPYNIISERYFSEEEAKKIFNKFVEEGFFITVFTVICPECHEYSKKIYNSCDEIYNSFQCSRCEFSFFEDPNIDFLSKNIRILYRVIEE